MTLWQRLWRSPWTWLGLSIYVGWLIAQTRPGVVWTIFNWIAFLVFANRFFHRANERWGTP